MGQHFRIKLITYGLLFPNDNSRVLVQDMKIKDQPVPIVWQQGFTYIPSDNNDIGFANLVKENFDLYADCYFEKPHFLTQPNHDRLFISHRDGRRMFFNSLSMFVDKIVYESNPPELYVPRILDLTIQNLSPVIYAADPGTFIFTDNTDEVVKAKKAIIFPGHMFDNHLTLD